MPSAVSDQTLGRAIEQIFTNKSLEDGADYLKEHPVKAWVLWVVTFGRYTANAQNNILEKKALLQAQKDQITLAIINAVVNPYGQYQCNMRMGYAGGYHDQLVIRQSATDPNAIEIFNQQTPTKITTHNHSFSELKKAMLLCYLREHPKDTPADLNKFDLTGIDLSDVDLGNTILDQINLAAVIASKGSLIGATLDDTVNVRGLVFRDIKMDQFILADVILKDGANLHGVNLADQNLSGMTLTNKDFTEANFTRADLSNSILNQSNFTDADFTGTNLQYVNLTDADLTGITTNPDAKGNDKKTNFSNSIMQGATGAIQIFRHKQLPPNQVMLHRDQVLEMKAGNHTDFTGVVLSHSKTYIRSGFSGKDLSGLIFNKAKLSGTNFCNANLSNAKFHNADLTNIQLNATTNLTGTDLTKADLSKVDLSNVTITGSTNITGVKLNGAKLNRSWVEQAIAQNVDLKGADLTDLDLHGLVNLNKLDLTGADLRNADLRGTSLNKSGLVAALNTRSVMAQNKDGQLVRTSVDLVGIVLVGTAQRPLVLSSNSTAQTRLDLSHADLTGATLTHCDLSGANLTGANFTGVDLSTTALVLVTGAKSVIVAANDCQYYETRYTTRLNFIVSGTKGAQDFVYSLTKPTLLKLRESVFFPLSDSSYQGALQLDNGPQDTYRTDGSWDIRIFVPKKQKKEPDDQLVPTTKEEQQKELDDAKVFINNRLRGNDFTKEQKELFHHARSATWAMGTLWMMHRGDVTAIYDKKIATATAAHEAGEMPEEELQALKEDIQYQETMMDNTWHTEVALDEIYLASRGVGRLRPPLMEACFNAVLPKFQANHPNVQADQIQAVKDFFMHEQCNW